MKTKTRIPARRHHQHTNYTISQNFLTSRRLLNRIVGRSSINKRDTVLEIGSGKGHLSAVLAKKCGFLISIEIDRKLYEQTAKKMSGMDNVHLVHGDFLKYRLPRSGRYKVFASIPFSLTTAIVKKLTHADQPPEEMWLVIEKGAAKRFQSTGDESTRALRLNEHWDLKIVHNFQRGDFHPKPAVDTVLMHFARKQNRKRRRKSLGSGVRQRRVRPKPRG